ncbi:hypothetical protein Hanom_Chr17g01530221 [Helianthus anomalus]
MSSTIIPSLTSFFSENDHHSQHPTINSHIPSQSSIYHTLSLSRDPLFTR